MNRQLDEQELIEHERRAPPAPFPLLIGTLAVDDRVVSPGGTFIVAITLYPASRLPLRDVGVRRRRDSSANRRPPRGSFPGTHPYGPSAPRKLASRKFGILTAPSARHSVRIEAGAPDNLEFSGRLGRQRTASRTHEQPAWL